MLRHIAALIFIFGCTSIAWMILGATVMERTHSSDDQLKGHVASTWGTPQEQAPPCGNVVWKETVAVNTKENGTTSSAMSKWSAPWLCLSTQLASRSI